MIIDAKGRLFGKINIIDLAIICFCFFLFPMFYYGLKLFHEQKKTINESRKIIAEQKQRAEFPEVGFNCRFINLIPDILRIVNTGDKAVDTDGLLTAEILSIDKDINTSENQKNTYARLKLKCRLKDNKIYYQDKLALDSTQVFTFNHPLGEKLEFVIVPVEGTEAKSKIIDVEGQTEYCNHEIQIISDRIKALQDKTEGIYKLTLSLYRTVKTLNENDQSNQEKIRVLQENSQNINDSLRALYEKNYGLENSVRDLYERINVKKSEITKVIDK